MKLGRTIWGYVSDLFMVPRRLKQLTDIRVAETDPREICRSCGKGRIGHLYNDSASAVHFTFGTCENCGMIWHIDRMTWKPVHPKL